MKILGLSLILVLVIVSVAAANCDPTYACPTGCQCECTLQGWTVIMPGSVTITPDTGSLTTDLGMPVISVPEARILRMATIHLPRLGLGIHETTVRAFQ